jgi:hypothetical protein
LPTGRRNALASLQAFQARPAEPINHPFSSIGYLYLQGSPREPFPREVIHEPRYEDFYVRSRGRTGTFRTRASEGD